MIATEIKYKCASCGEPLETISTFDDVFATTVSLEPCDTCLSNEWQKGRDFTKDHSND